MSEHDTNSPVNNNEDTPQRRSANRMFKDIVDLGDIRKYFAEHSYKDTHTEQVDLNQQQNCLFIDVNSENELGVVLKFNTIAEIMEYTSMQKNKENMLTISCIFSGGKETIYNANSKDDVLISKTLGTGEIFFIKSSMIKVEEPEERKEQAIELSLSKDIDNEPKLIPETKLHFIFFQDWLNYQDVYLKKYKNQQGKNNVAV